MKQLSLFIIYFVGVASLLLSFGCSSCKDVKADFLMNAQTRISSEEQPAPDDFTKVMNVFVGDPVYFRNISDTINGVDKQFWEFTGDGSWDVEGEDFTEWVFTELGPHKVILCINGDKNCTAKWVNVREKFFEPDPDTITIEPYIPPTKPTPVGGGTAAPPPLAPTVQFLIPHQNVESKVSNYNLEAHVTNVKKPDELNLTVNDRVFNQFNFNRNNGKVTAKVTLNKGPNNIVLTAITKGGTATTPPIVVTYTPPEEWEDGVKVGIPRTSHQSSYECIGSLKETSVSMTLNAHKDIKLKSCYVYFDNCGSVKVTLKGPEGTREFTTDANNGRTQISFMDMLDNSLKSGNTYTLTFTAFNNDCGAGTAPKFEEQTCENAKSISTEQLKLDQKKLILFDLTYSYKK